MAYNWTDEQIEYVKQNYGTLKVHTIKNHLGCSWETVKNLLVKLELELPVSEDWTDEEIRYLRDYAPKKHYYKIAKKLKKTNNAVYLKACRLKIKIIKDKGAWDLEDETYLIESWNDTSIENICKNLKRTRNAVVIRAQKLELGERLNTEIWTIKDMTSVLKVSRDVIMYWYKHKGLELKEQKKSNKSYYYGIVLENLLKFLKANQDLWYASKVELYTLGEEKEWLTEKRKNERDIIKKEYHIWTDEEESMIKNLIKLNYSPLKIAARTNKSEGSIKARIKELGIEYKSECFWKDTELEFLKDNYMKMTYKELSNNKELNSRTVKAIGAKLKELGLSKRNKK